jgi:hypothetical protein
MAEINERASTSVDCPLSPSSSVSDEIRYLSADSFDKISTYVQGQVDSKLFLGIFLSLDYGFTLVLYIHLYSR